MINLGGEKERRRSSANRGIIPQRREAIRKITFFAEPNRGLKQ